MNLPPYAAFLADVLDEITYPDTRCERAVEDRGIAGLTASAERNREYGLDLAHEVLSITHPPVIMGGRIIVQTISN